jgi:hypothetical protein
MATHAWCAIGRYDHDGSGLLNRLEFDAFMHVMRGDVDDSDPSEPPAGCTDDLSSVRAGSAVIAFYATEGLWYAATVNGVYPASDGTDNGVVHGKYYWITFTGYDTSESVYAERIRVKKVETEPRPKRGRSRWACCATRTK